MRAIKKLLEIITPSRSKDGCAWDKKQTHESLLPHLVRRNLGKKIERLMDAVKKKLSKQKTHIKKN